MVVLFMFVHACILEPTTILCYRYISRFYCLWLFMVIHGCILFHDGKMAANSSYEFAIVKNSRKTALISTGLTCTHTTEYAILWVANEIVSYTHEKPPEIADRRAFLFPTNQV